MPQKNTSTPPDISFIMPCYKDAPTLYTAVHSLLDQDWDNIEVIIVNDGSPDDANKIIDKLEKEDKRVKSIRFKQNKGACKARNEGAKIAKGRYFSFLPADAFLYPGNIRVWVEILDQHQEVDFVYGGYRFVKAISQYGGEVIQEYKSEQFDPYLLETANYIDGSFPMRRQVFERVGGWSEDVKSLQDWDLWLKIVRSGSKGLFFGDLFFETDYPHAGGLSFDSSNNWVERTNYIKKKNGIPIRKMCVTSLGAGWHAKNIAKILDADFSEMPSYHPHEYETLYVIGFYPQFADLQFEMFRDNQSKEGITTASKIVHLVGTDIWQMQQLSKQQLDVYKNFFNIVVDAVLCEDKFTQDELKELGIQADIVPIPPVKLFKPMPLPKDFTVACYMPQVNKAFYRPDLMLEIAKAMPDVNFKFFGDPNEVKTEGNIQCLGFLNREAIETLIKETSCLLRFTIHDGLSINSLEYLLASRQVVSSTPVKHAIFVNRPDKRLLINAIRKAQQAGENKEGSKYWTKELNHKLYKKRLKDFASYNPKKYWEQRADHWDLQAGEKWPDLESLEPIFMEYKPRTILDVGCGNGRWLPYFQKQGVNYRGIDISEKLIRIAQEKYPEGMFKACKIEDIPKPPKKFDMAFSYTTLEHITEKEFPKAVKALKQAAKVIVLVEPINFKTRSYCIDHPYQQWFNILKEIKLADKMIYVCDDKPGLNGQ